MEVLGEKVDGVADGAIGRPRKVADLNIGEAEFFHSKCDGANEFFVFVSMDRDVVDECL